MQKLVKGALVILSVSVLASCAKKEFEKNANGLEYKFFTKNEGRHPKPEDILKVSIVYKTNSDSLLDKREMFTFGLTEPTFKGGMEEAFTLMSPGDSALFLVSADSIFSKTFGQEMPPYFKKGDKMHFYVKLHGFVDEATEAAELSDYVKKNNISSTPTSTGMYYIESVAGSGDAALPGDTAFINYTGKFLDGKIFDSNAQQGSPMAFPMGLGAVIPGFEEAVKMMTPGSKAQVILPSKIAYGKFGTRGIPPYSTLIFDLELVKVVKGNGLPVAPVAQGVPVDSTHGH